MVNRLQRWMGFVLITIALMVGGCGQDTATPTASASPTETSPAPTETTTVLTNQPSTAQFGNLPRLDGKATVVMTVKGSPITIEVDGTDAPITAGNFVDLVQRKVYDGTTFHRVVREPQPFVVQGGDPQSKDASVPAELLGTGSFIDPDTSQPRFIPLEIEPQGRDQPVYGQVLRDAGVTAAPKLQHTRGAVAMARSTDPNSASAQFYVALADLDFLDGSYAVFGRVTEGMEVVDKIQQGDRIESARVTQGIDNLKTGKQAEKG
jgi:peptidyl-prolyl cis-trans isomerase B (cyclophilin B)